MTRLAYILLVHESPEYVSELLDLLLRADPTGVVAVHYDAQRERRLFQQLKQKYLTERRALFVTDRVSCGWGQFGLVEGVLRAIRLITSQEIDCDYICLLSGSCRPLRPIAQLKRFLGEAGGAEFIESRPESWIFDGLRSERYKYRHWFSYRAHGRLFSINWRLQKSLGISRRFPSGLEPKFGSQWWCLTRDTCSAILQYVDKHPRIYSFFKSTWIPDEMFFQTLVRKVTKSEAIAGSTLTYSKFNLKGKPINFYDDHVEDVATMQHFFIRKISPAAKRLRDHLAATAMAPDDGSPLSQVPPLTSSFNPDARAFLQTSFPRPGHMFWSGQKFDRWPSSLAANSRSFMILYGPPVVTAAAANCIARETGATILGRIFRRDEVDFGCAGRSLDGLHPEDSRIRDLDPPLFLSRVLERAPSLPVIQLCPGEERLAEGALCHLDQAHFVVCRPDADVHSDWMRLFWALAAAELATNDGPLIPGDERSRQRQFVRQAIDLWIGRSIPQAHRDWIAPRLLSEPLKRRALPLYWGPITCPAEKRRAQVEASRDFVMSAGPDIASAMGAIPGAAATLARLSSAELLSRLPVQWRAYFELLFADSVLEAQAPRSRGGSRAAICAVEDTREQQ